MPNTNTEFEFCGVNHIAMVCRDMAKTVEFYRDILGMPLIKTLDLPGNSGQHFFFDIGNGDSLAFFWFADAPPAAPGIATPAYLPSKGSMVSAHGSMNHLALNIRAEKFDEYYQRLIDKGIEVSPVLNHDEAPRKLPRNCMMGCLSAPSISLIPMACASNSRHGPKPSQTMMSRMILCRPMGISAWD